MLHLTEQLRTLYLNRKFKTLKQNRLTLWRPCQVYPSNGEILKNMDGT